MDSKVGPFTLADLVDMWTKDGMLKIADGNVNSEGTRPFVRSISDISEDVCFQLHSGIMKSARRVLLDEVISGTIPELLGSKKPKRDITLKEASTDGTLCPKEEVKYL